MKINLLALLLMLTLLVHAVETNNDDAIAGENYIHNVAGQSDQQGNPEPASELQEQPIEGLPKQPQKRLLPPGLAAADNGTESQTADPVPEVGTENTAADSAGEHVWQEISSAIARLNKLVGDDLFRELVRKSGSEMEVRVDPEYWKRVRYETRVELKTDIAQIWHLYARQYNDAPASAVFFIDDDTGKTIDIYTRAAQ